MRHEFTRVSRQAQSLADALDFALQLGQFRPLAYASPDRMRFLAAKLADTCQFQMKGRAVDAVERIGEFIGDMAFDVAEETQGDVVILGVDQARSGQATAQQ